MKNDYQQVIEQHIQGSIEAKQSLLQESFMLQIESIGKLMGEAVANGKKILFCGNGGSAADCQHLAAELVIRLRGDYERPGIPALALTVDPSIMTAGGNDLGFDNVFARSVEAYGSVGDILVGISTSGNSKNVINAFHKASSIGLVNIGLLGRDGGEMKSISDYDITIPSDKTPHIQESHILVGHLLCQIIEETVYPR